MSRSTHKPLSEWHKLQDSFYIWLFVYIGFLVFWVVPVLIALDLSSRRGLDAVRWDRFALWMVPATIAVALSAWMYSRARHRLMNYDAKRA